MTRRPPRLPLPRRRSAKRILRSPTRAFDHVTGLRVAQQEGLQIAKRVVVQVIRPITLEGRQLDKDGLHTPYYTQLAYVRNLRTALIPLTQNSACRRKP